MKRSRLDQRWIAALGMLSACALAAAPAVAHKGMDNHTHCSVQGKGVEVRGATDAQRKAGCGQIHGAVWDDREALLIDKAANDAALKQGAGGAAGR